MSHITGGCQKSAKEMSNIFEWHLNCLCKNIRQNMAEYYISLSLAFLRSISFVIHSFSSDYSWIFCAKLSWLASVFLQL